MTAVAESKVDNMTEVAKDSKQYKNFDHLQDLQNLSNGVNRICTNIAEKMTAVAEAVVKQHDMSYRPSHNRICCIAKH